MIRRLWFLRNFQKVSVDDWHYSYVTFRSNLGKPEGMTWLDVPSSLFSQCFSVHSPANSHFLFTDFTYCSVHIKFPLRSFLCLCVWQHLFLKYLRNLGQFEAGKEGISSRKTLGTWILALAPASYASPDSFWTSVFSPEGEWVGQRISRAPSHWKLTF